MSQGQHGQGGARDGRDRRAAEERQIAGAINSLHRDYKSAQDKRATYEGGAHKWHKAATLSAIVYTVITACVLAGTVYSIIQTWSAIGVANQAATAATSQATTADDTEKRSLRAYIAIPPGDVENFGTSKQSITLMRKNTGITPAYDVGILTASAAIIFHVGESVPGNTTCVRPKLSDMFTIFPNTPVPLTISFDDVTYHSMFKQNLLDTISANESRGGIGYTFAYYGTLCYNDAFKRPHYTNFCYMYHGKSMKAADAIGCLTHNDSD